jgi:hypothetical protein
MRPNRSCASAFPTEEYGHFREDVATIWLDASLSMSDAPGLAHMNGTLPGAFMLSARTGLAHPVCRAFASGDVAEAQGSVEKGDSGSSVVAVRHDGTPLILGIVSHRWQENGRWYFAMLPESLPWPTAATIDAPPIPWFDLSDLSEIEDCPQ